MGKHFFDYDDGDFAHTISDNMAMDSDGDLLMRISTCGKQRSCFVGTAALQNKICICRTCDTG